MNIFFKLYNSIRNLKNSQKRRREDVARQSKEGLHLEEFHAFMSSLLTEQTYISRRVYSEKQESYREMILFFEVLMESGMLNDYCRKNRLSLELVHESLDWYQNIDSVIEEHNERYVLEAMDSEKDYLDSILHDIDSQIMLDEDQRRVVLTDEDYCLVIAGAGAGKTTTVAAKVKYLVEKKGIDPRQILIVSFTNKAVQELRDKINQDLSIPCPISTFHSVGNAIIHKNSPEEKLSIVDGSRLYFVVRNYFRDTIMQNEKTVDKLGSSGVMVG